MKIQNDMLSAAKSDSFKEPLQKCFLFSMLLSLLKLNLPLLSPSLFNTGFIQVNSFNTLQSNCIILCVVIKYILIVYNVPLL